MENKLNARTGIDELIKNLVNGIDVNESTEWGTSTRDISKNIRNDLVKQFNSYKSECDKKFLDYCNCIKSLLSVYNFGNLPTVDELTVEGASSIEIEKCRKDTEDDKRIIKDGVQNILKHIKEVGFDITPYLDAEDCMQIFGDAESEKIVIPVTISATTVMTTLVYFRRAYRRVGLYSDSELTVTKGKLGLLNEDSTDISDCVAQAVAKIMYLIAKYVFDGNSVTKYNGWGFTLDVKQSQRTTLNDTYAVVDAISRFEDAFDQDDESKRDGQFLAMVEAYCNEIGFRGSIVKYCSNSIYRTAYTTYARDKTRMYGKNLFYITNSKVNNEITYSYNPISYEQIASSNRSSALFNPLYVAMITMYGYNDKEVVIRRFMDDVNLANQYLEKYEPSDGDEEFSLPEGVEYTLSQYAEKKLKFTKDFKTEVQLLITPHSAVSYDYENPEWARYYYVARVFQKYLETQLPGELMKIEEYRDFLNSTKDAIDQVQVAYRKFDDSQRLGIVDTDYLMFSSLDLSTDSVTVSKLNKANISANYMRPLLLSSKIMIVNALTKYPQADMSELYEAIKESKHRKIEFKKRGGKGEKSTEWLWNEDIVDMNSTARHCEAIMYDYFDYYERYELSYKALNNLKKYYNGLITDKSIDFANGDVDYEKLLSDESMSEFKRVVLNFTRQNVNKVKALYSEHLRDKDKVLHELEKEKEELQENHQKQIAKLKEEYEKKLSDERKGFEEERQKQSVSLGIGNTVREWIRAEADRHLSEMLGYMILNNINSPSQKGDDDFKVKYMMRGEARDEMADGKFSIANQLAQKIMSDYKKNAEGVEQIYGDKFKSALSMQTLLEGALDDLLKLDEIKDTARGMLPLKDKNESIRETYAERKRNRKAGKFNTQEEKMPNEETNNEEDGKTDN